MTIKYLIILIIFFTVNSCNIHKLEKSGSEIFFFDVYIIDESQGTSVSFETNHLYAMKADSVYNVIEDISFAITCLDFDYVKRMSKHKSIIDRMINTNVEKVDAFSYKNTVKTFFVRPLIVKGKTTTFEADCVDYDLMSFSGQFICVDSIYSIKKFKMNERANIVKVKKMLDVIVPKRKSDFKIINTTLK